ncbi:MAG: DNA mismatch endonuclease Vsr [Paludibacteraceae bacterium]|nr:DNA mismatch endonuclease Vsr [Paludibacteraceae bacterium]
MDSVSPQKRSWNMSRIRSKNTKPELLVRRFLFGNGYRYRINVKSLPGTPDIVLKKYHTVIFIHGCFWHRHECLRGKMPKTHTQFWEKKFTRNQERDLEVRNQLKMMGWNTLIIWECQLKPSQRAKTLEEINYWLNEAYLNQFRNDSPTPHREVLHSSREIYNQEEDSESLLAAEDFPEEEPII